MPAGKLILCIGLGLTLIGAALIWAPWLVNWFGKLPGDMRIQREGFGFYFPWVSMILVSVVLTILMNALFKH